MCRDYVVFQRCFSRYRSKKAWRLLVLCEIPSPPYPVLLFSLHYRVSINSSEWFFKKSSVRESKGFVEIRKNVFETLSVKYGSRFPRGIATFARGAPPGYTPALIKMQNICGYYWIFVNRRRDYGRCSNFPQEIFLAVYIQNIHRLSHAGSILNILLLKFQIPELSK